MKIPFVKTQAAGNDFLLTWEADAPGEKRADAARAICSRHTGVGADGWYVVRAGGEAPDATKGCDAAIHLYNSDGSEAELSGNGTRCAAAMLVEAGRAGDPVRILTGAGAHTLRLLDRSGRRFFFEMEMGEPVVADEELRWKLPLSRGTVEVTTLDVGNPQCAVFVDEFPENWMETAAAIEAHPRFPRRTNVSFVRVVDRHTIEARFYERGAGVTLSSGTGSMGAAVAGIARGVIESPVRVVTAAGPLELRWDETVYLAGPAQIVAQGEFYWSAGPPVSCRIERECNSF